MFVIVVADHNNSVFNGNAFGFLTTLGLQERVNRLSISLFFVGGANGGLGEGGGWAA